MYRVAAALFALLIAGCPGGGECPDGPAPPVVSACAVPASGWNPGDGEGVTADVTGEVTEVGTGAPPDGCFDQGHPGGEDDANATWIRVTEGGEVAEEWVVAWVAPSSAPAIAVSDTVSFSYSFRFGGFSPDVGHLTLRDATGALSVWIGAAGSIETLTSPDELTLVKGPARCTTADVCGDWQEYALDVAIEGTDPATVDWGNTATFGDYTFHHAGFAQDTRTSPNCQDWFVGDLDAALVRTP